MDGNGLVKTTKFGSPKYVGDPLNTVRLFNEKEVDELLVFDIRATVENRDPDYELIKNLAAECRMPLCYGGGVRTADQADRIISLGVEKVSISSSAVSNPALVTEMARRIGSQSVVVAIDVKSSNLGGGYEVRTHNGLVATHRHPVEVAIEVERGGAGEIVINSIDRDGTMGGYDLSLARLVRDAVSCPITVLGGAGSLKDIAGLIEALGVVGSAAGSLFVFKGPYRAVLINYPERSVRDSLLVRDSEQ